MSDQIDLETLKVDLIEDASWYWIADNITQIKNRDSSPHPCLIRYRKDLKYNFLKVWVRSASDRGPNPRWVTHDAHNKGDCNIDKKGWIDLKRFHNIPLALLGNMKFSCKEGDFLWLAYFDDNCSRYFTLSVLHSD